MGMDMNRRRRPPGLRAMLDYMMALIWVLFGSFIIFSRQMLGYDFFAESALLQGGMKWAIGIMIMLYGLFRAYRGYQLSKEQQDEE